MSKLTDYVMIIKKYNPKEDDESKHTCIRIDDMLVHGILDNWDYLMNSPEYTLYQKMEKIREEQRKKIYD